MKTDIRKHASHYVKIVEWSDEDHCYVGRCPELFGGGTHGKDEARVYAELCAMVEEAIEDRLAEKKPLPPPATAQKYSGKFLLRTGAELHKALSVRAFREGKSLNQVCLEAFQLSTAPLKVKGKKLQSA
jgi:predicted HicB family RNase H-like nuclease